LAQYCARVNNPSLAQYCAQYLANIAQNIGPILTQYFLLAGSILYHLRVMTLNNTVNLKSGLKVTQGH